MSFAILQAIVKIPSEKLFNYANHLFQCDNSEDGLFSFLVSDWSFISPAHLSIKPYILKLYSLTS